MSTNIDKQYNSMIMLPISSTSLILGKYLLSNNHNIYLYCPDELNLRQASSIPTDLKLAALNLETSVEIVDTLEKSIIMDFIVFPNLDLMPRDVRSDFGYMCKDLFR